LQDSGSSGAGPGQRSTIAKIKAGHLLENPVQAPMFQNLTTLNFSDILKKPGLSTTHNPDI